DQQDIGNGITVQSDGRIVFCGQSFGTGVVVSVVGRLTSTGVLDSTFGGGDGLFTATNATPYDLRDVKVQSDGKLVVVGSSSVSSQLDGLMMRLSPAGDLDTTFNSTGILTFPFGTLSDLLMSLVIQADGKYVAGGFWQNPTPNLLETVLVRVTPAGALDSGFATGGIKKIALATGNNRPAMIGQASDGKIVVALEAGATNSEDFMAARFQNTVTAAPSLPDLSINDVSLNEGNSGTTNFTFTVSLSSPAQAGGITFDIATANGTANQPLDYTQKSLTAQTIAAGSSSYTFTVLVNGDTTNEQNETFFVNVTNVTGATVLDGQGSATIVNDDPPPSISINDVSQAEGNSGTTTMSFTVSLSAPSSQPITVNYATANGTATTANGDYVATSGTAFFSPGQITQPVNVTVNGDTDIETNESFFVNLSGANGATINDSQGLGTITNDDVGAPEISVSGNATSITDGDLTPSTLDGTDYGSTPVTGGSVEHTFTITNSGTALLNVGTVSTTGDFSVTQQPAATVAAGGGTTTFKITFDPSALGTRTGTVSFSNDDGDENPFNFSVQGAGVETPSLIVTTVSDSSTPTDNQTSLREAIAYAATLSGPQTITFSTSTASGAVNFFDGTTHTITLGGTELGITSDLTITAPGADKLTISGNNASRVFNLSGGTTTAMSGLTVADGRSTNGAGILNASTLTMTACTITSNLATGAYSCQGGGITSTGTLRLDRCALINNQVREDVGGNGYGGGLYADGVASQLTNCTISGNSVAGTGAAFNFGGAVYVQTSLALTNCTVTGNSVSGGATARGGGINRPSPGFSARNTIIA
ncbi:MAG: choice-of-anchor D domain-containing protein, partial [Verrucomicrobiales bacterium]|nr:choice-of-anchor D domain-containing protein [Verrucomicrobiales bacterium]